MKAIRRVIGPVVAFASLAGVVTGATAQTCAVTEFPCEVSELNEGTAAAADGAVAPTTILPDDEFLPPRYNAATSDSDTDSGDSESDGGESEAD